MLEHLVVLVCPAGGIKQCYDLSVCLSVPLLQFKLCILWH